MFPVMAGSAFAWLYPDSPAMACTAVWALLAAQFLLQIANQDWKLLGVSPPLKPAALTPACHCCQCAGVIGNNLVGRPPPPAPPPPTGRCLTA